ncbi:MAG: fibronectin-binding domain-containing protein [Nitrosopumilales archaeon]|nr:MAG: fibronectin-binding domain-containing protein [Nitrosopumilales archaeon]
MTLAGIELRYLVNEISKNISEYYVSNIYGISRNSILFKLHHPEKPDILLMFSTFGFWITTRKIEQIEENRLVKRLRSDLLRSKISEIKQIGTERIVYITFSGLSQEFVLVGEFFGDGNIVLCNKEMKILSLLHSIDVRHRKLNVGFNYELPPLGGLNIFEMALKDLLDIKSVSTATVRWIGRTLGLPTKYAEEIMKLANIDPQSPGNSLSDNDIEKIFSVTKSITEKVVNGVHEPLVVRDEKTSDVLPLPLGSMENKNCTRVESFMEGLDLLFTENLLEAGKTSQANTVTQKIEEFEHKLEEQTKAISTVKQRTGSISTVAKSLLELTSKGIASLEDPNILQMFKDQNTSLVKERGISFLIVKDEKIKINPESSIPAIASTLFNESKRQLKAIETIELEKRKTERILEGFRKQASIAKDSVVFSVQKKKEWYERYRWFFTSDGLLAIGGRDASSNSSVIRKHLEKDDKVFHAEIVGSPFFLLKNSSDNTVTSVKETAHATVCFSRAWREGLYGLNAYWVTSDQIKTAAPSGQFIAKGSFIVEGTRSFVQVTTLQLSVGLYQKGDSYSLMCGPSEPIKKNCVYYVTIEPSGLEMVEAAKKIKIEFQKFKEKEEIVKAISIDDFIRVLPAGDSHIVESGTGQAFN